ncbi:MAG TPA: 4'-phosphopantetheinyl transferase superfamily protein [Arenimonas sp.]|nr:4'-phosphopantetheinyl transferase superfamily protein [Arenimonas sp.]
MTDCHVELAALEAIESLATLGLDWLTPAERQRLEKITTPLRRRQFLAGHWLVRDLAARCRGGAAADWQLESDDRGQPTLRNRGGRLAASISHSERFIAVAVATQAVGLDLEYPGRPRDLAALAGFVFSPAECQALEAAPADQRVRRFLSTWSLKEAFGKRSGDGLQPSRARRMLARESGPESAEAWLWQLSEDGVLALAAWPGARITLQSSQKVPAPGTWCYESLPG